MGQRSRRTFLPFFKSETRSVGAILNSGYRETLCCPYGARQFEGDTYPGVAAAVGVLHTRVVGPRRLWRCLGVRKLAFVFDRRACPTDNHNNQFELDAAFLRSGSTERSFHLSALVPDNRKYTACQATPEESGVEPPHSTLGAPRQALAVHTVRTNPAIRSPSVFPRR